MPLHVAGDRLYELEVGIMSLGVYKYLRGTYYLTAHALCNGMVRNLDINP